MSARGGIDKMFARGGIELMRCIARKDDGSRCELPALRKFAARSGPSSVPSSVQRLCGRHQRRLLTGAKPLLEAGSGKPIRKPRR
jgi:hypothetical protein